MHAVNLRGPAMAATNLRRHGRIAAAPRPSPDPTSLLERGTQALWTDGDLAESRSLFDAAYRAAQCRGDALAMGRAAVGFAGLWAHGHRQAPVAALLDARLRRSLRLVDPDSSVALRIRARLAAEADYRIGRLDALFGVLEEVRAGADPVARAEALSLAHHCLLGPDHAHARHRLAQELMAESWETSRRGDMLSGMLAHTVDLLLEADAHAERRLAELRQMLRSLDHLAVGYVVEAVGVMLDVRAGRFAEAETHAAQAIRRGIRAGDPDAVSWNAMHLVSIRWFQGRLGELTPTLGEAVNSPTLSAIDHSVTASLALAYAVGGETEQATTLVARLGRAAPRSGSWLPTMYATAECALLIGDREACARLYADLLPYGHLPAMLGPAVVCFGSVQHALGVAAAGAGDLDGAISHLREATTANDVLGHAPAAVLSRARLGQALNLRGGPHDDADAHRVLQAAQREAGRLGIPVPRWPAESERFSVPGNGEPVASCQRNDYSWTVRLGGRSVTVPHNVGMPYLAELLANPGQEIPSSKLAAGPAAPDELAAIRAGGSLQPMLDDTARRAYQQRLTQLRKDLELYDVTGDAERARPAHAEVEWLLSQLGAATGLGGRTRSFSTLDERARVSVGKAIKRALQRIDTADPIIGERLIATIHTGYRCSYTP